MFFYSFVAFVLLAPLYKGGNRPLALLLLEFAAVAFLFVIIAVHRTPIALPRTLYAAIGTLLVYPLVQIIPLPEALWVALPGHAEYAAVFQQFASKDLGGIWHAISVVPSRTEYGWLAMVPALACLLAPMRLSPVQVGKLLLLMTVFAAAESVLGLLQAGSGGSLGLLRNEQALGLATGTFVNRNHFAAMLAMMLPVVVGLLVFGMRPGRRRRNAARNRSEVVAQRALLFASAVLILICLLFTRSKGGIATGFVGLIASAIVLVRARAASEGTRRTRVAMFVVFGVVGIGIVLAVLIGVSPILERFEAAEMRALAQGRLKMLETTYHAAMDFMPFGSGLSTFAEVFPRFQLGFGFGGLVDHAHNDYMQAFLELGLAGPIVIALLLAAYVSRFAELLWQEGGRSFTLLQLAAAVGMLPLILHSLFDFALHIPSNAMWFATLAGVMFHRTVAPLDPAAGEVRKPESLRRPASI